MADAAVLALIAATQMEAVRSKPCARGGQKCDKPMLAVQGTGT